MAEVDFSDLKSAEAWFKVHSPEVRCTMAARGALRVLPRAVHTETVDRETVALATLYCVLIAVLSGKGQNIGADKAYAACNWTRSISRSVTMDAYRPISNSTQMATAAINCAANAAYSAHNTYGSSAMKASTSTRLATLFSPPEILTAFLWDSQNEHTRLHNFPLWSGVDVPEQFQSGHAAFTKQLTVSPKWRFFHDWYIAMWEGTFENWKLAFEIADIDIAIWQKGIEAVAAEIERIQAKLAVKDFIDDLRNQSKLDKASRHGVGGNNPPEPISDTSLNRSVTLIWASIDALEQEAEKTQPSIAVVEAKSQSLKSGLAALLKWVGGKADLAVDSAIKSGIPAGAGYIVLNPDKISTLLELVKYWLQLLH